MLRIEIIGIEDFLAFVAIIRNEELDVDKIKKLTKELNSSTDKLIEAEKKDG